MDQAEIKGFARFAQTLADQARAEALHWFARAPEASDKNEGLAGFDPVTEGDRAAERSMRASIEASYRDHGIAGEEYGDKPALGPWSWSLDPIDGTRAFICGLPSWTTLIALLHEGRPVVGVIDVARLDERYVASPGEAKQFGPQQRSALLQVSTCQDISQARLSTTDPYLFSGQEAEAFTRVREAVRLTRYGLDAYAYARLAGGTLDLVIESGLKPHDYNALIPVVRGSGGVIGNWRGEDEFRDGAVVAAATPALFEEAVRMLNP